MKQAELRIAIVLGMLVLSVAPWKTLAAQTAENAAQPAQTVSGGRLHGVVKSGATPLPGVTVTAQNTLTGKRVATTTDLAGAWTLALSQNGRYVVRAQFAGFAQGAQEAVLNADSHEQALNFDLLLASRAAVVEKAETAAESGAITGRIQRLSGNGAQSLTLTSSLSADTETQGASGAQTGATSGAELPQVAGNSDFSGESVAISGQSGQVSALAGVDMDRMRDSMETMRAQMGGPGGVMAMVPGGGFGGGGMFGGGPGGFGGGMGGRGGRGNFRGFNPGQPHGSFFWQGSNSALDAQNFSLTGLKEAKPASGTNRFGITFMSAPYIPGWTKPSGKDTVFLTLSGQRSSTPQDSYATVPTVDERGGNFSASGLPPIYDPTTQRQFAAPNASGTLTNNIIPSTRIAAQATALLKYFPSPNLSQSVNNYNYRLLTTQQNNQTQIGARYMRSLGKNATMTGGGRNGFGSGSRRKQSQGLRQSINFNYNWSHSAADNVNVFPQLGGKNWSTANSLQAGYTVGYKKVTSIFNANWNRSQSETTNFFTNTKDVATEAGICGAGSATATPGACSTVLNADPLNYGVPKVTLSSITGLSELQPSQSVSQTISLSETVSWIYGKHNLRFGGDYRRVHRDSLGGSNATGTFTFTGLFTQDPAGDSTTGSSIADFLLGLPQSTTINSSASKSYLRDNVLDGYAQDDWRVNHSLTLNYGVRYEFFAPYTEKFGHLAMVDTNPGAGFTSQSEVQAGQAGASSGKLPDGLVFPFRKAFAPRVGFAWRVPWIPQTVLRGGYGMNFTVGQYGSFASSMAHQPMPNAPNFVNEQTNEETNASGKASSACALGATAATLYAGSCFTLANGYGAPDTVGNYAVDPHYQLPHIQAWNLNLQKTLPWGIVMNAGYNGSKAGNLDIKSSPNATAQVFTYEQASAYSRYNAGTVSAQKRMSGGLALGAFYQYGHSIDNSVSMAQDWQNLGAEEANSSGDIRHSVNGNYLYELPFGEGRRWATSGKAKLILEGFSVSGTFKFATGTPLTPIYQASVTGVARGTGATSRPDRKPGVGVMDGGYTLKQWFNPKAFQTPQSDVYGNAFGNTPRNSIPGPGTVSNNMTLSKTMQLGDTRSWELRATSANVFNTVQYSSVDTNVSSSTFGQVNGTSAMRSFQFETRFRF
ncbi:MAG: TonB-dependent receptor [Terracidiphilus sp.]|nr:TonB-dependent receptor [Terracidiphilus sp.]